MKTKLLFLLTAVLSLYGLQAQVSLPYYDGIDYTIGEKLITEGTNTGFGDWMIPAFQSAGSSADPFIVASPVWSLPAGLPAATGNAMEFVGGGDDPVIPIPDQGDTGVIYSSFVFRAIDQSAVNTNSPEYFYSFAKTSSSGTSLNYTSCVYIRKVDDATFNLGISENNNTTNAVWAPNAFTLDQDLFVVIYYDIDNAVSKMWINPVVDGNEPATTYVTDETATSTRTNLDKVRINLGSNSKTPGIILDEVRIGNSWLAVTTNPTASVSKNEIANNVRVYPNPSRNFLNVETNNMTVTSLQFYNILGATVYTQNGLLNNKVDISTLASGVYLMKINSGDQSVTKKIIKE
jgi:hypothetical protein